MRGSAIARVGTRQGAGDVMVVAIQDALVADDLINRFCGGVGGLDPPTDRSQPLKTPEGEPTRPVVDLLPGETYREGRIFRSESAIPMSMKALPSIQLSVLTRESPPQIGGFHAVLEVGMLIVAEVVHRKIPRSDPSLDGLLGHIERYLSLKRHQLLKENANGGVDLTKRLVTFALNRINIEPASEETVFKSFEAVVSYETTPAQWTNPPARV